MGDDGTPYKGVTIEKRDVDRFLKVLVSALTSEKTLEPFKMYSIGAKKFPIYISFGAFEETGEFSKEITYIDWGQDPKFDIRGWKDDYTKCSKGINLKENELRVLEELLKNEIKVSNEKSSSEQYKSEENDDAFDLENELLQ